MMENLQLRRTVLRVIGALFLACAAEIPEHNLAVIAGASQNRLFEGMPRDRLDRVRVTLQRVKLRLQVSDIPEANGLVGGTGRQDRLGSRVEGNGVNGIAMLTLSHCSSASTIGRANIENLESDVIGNSTDKRCVKRMVLDIVDNGGVVGVSAGRSEGLVALCEGSKIPVSWSLARYRGD